MDKWRVREGRDKSGEYFVNLQQPRLILVSRRLTERRTSSRLCQNNLNPVIVEPKKPKVLVSSSEFKLDLSLRKIQSF